MSKYIRDLILIITYGFCVLTQLIFSSFMQLNKDNLEEILFNYKNITECKNDAIYRLNNGILINNSLALIISSSIIIGGFILMMINYLLINMYSKRYHYISLDNPNNANNINNLDNLDNKQGIISTNLISREKYDITINIIFIMGIIAFIVCNGIQFVSQLNNITSQCLYFIDNKIEKFYVIYKFMTCISFLSSFALFFIIPCFI